MLLINKSLVLVVWHLIGVSDCVAVPVNRYIIPLFTVFDLGQVDS